MSVIHKINVLLENKEDGFTWVCLQAPEEFRTWELDCRGSERAVFWRKEVKMGNPAMNKYRALWAAVLVRAIDDLDLDQSKKDVRIYESAVRWFNNARNTDIGSFIWVCEILGHDPDKTRDKIFHNHGVYSDRQQTAGGVR